MSGPMSTEPIFTWKLVCLCAISDGVPRRSLYEHDRWLAQIDTGRSADLTK